MLALHATRNRGAGARPAANVLDATLGAKCADTVRAPASPTWHETPLTVHGPLQPTNLYPGPALASRTRTAPGVTVV